ncbi:MAG TPA: hypothetical protein VE129_08030, partial [Thermoanaerobaculia bacterium]|nr:hypothetical protein [Thermoanaerobaculia bacterium]
MRRAAATAVLALLLSIHASSARATAATGAPPPPEPAEVTVGSRVVATLRAEIFGKTPAARAHDANRNLDEVVRGRAWGDVQVRSEPIGRIVFVGSRMVFGLVPGDLEPEGGETLDTVSASVAKNLAQALAEMRERRNAKDLLLAILWSLVATALFILIAVSLRRLRQFLERRLVTLTQRIAARLEAGGKGFVPLLWMTGAVTWAVRIAITFGHVFVAYLWLTYVLRRFPWTRAWGEELGQLLSSTARAFGAAALRQLPDLAIVVFIALFTRLLVKLSNAFFDAIEAGRLKVSEALAETAKPTRRIAASVLWVFALIMAYPYLPGSETEAFKGVTVLIGLLV